MDEILYLEPDEEITSVIDKLKKANADSVGLVIPRSATLVHSIVNLKLLKKEAESLNKDIALVMTDRIGKNIASQVGIPVYEDVHAKRPVNAHAMPDLPKGDEVIEVDMSGGHTKESTHESSKDEAFVVKQYDADIHREKDVPVNEPHEQFRKHSVGAVDDEPERSKSEPSAPEVAHHESRARHEEVTMSRSKKKSKKRLIVAFVLLAVLIIASAFGLPQSTVVVTVAAESFEQTVPIAVSSEEKEADGEVGTLAAKGELFTVENDDARRVTATGKKDVGGKATGSVTVSNAWDSNPLKLNAGTTFTATDGKVFELADAVTVPGATAELRQGQLVVVAGKVTATIKATEPGESYNIKASKFSIQGIPSERQDKIFGESTKDFSGGFTKQVSVMTQGDIDKAKDEMVDDLKEKAQQELTKQTKDQKLLAEALVSDVVSVETNPKEVGTETDYFDLKVKVKNQVMTFDEKVVNKAVDVAIRAKVPDDKELLLGEDDEFVIEVDKTDYDNQQLVLAAKVKTKIGTRVDPQEAKQGLAGKSRDEVEATLSRLPNVKDVELRKFPSWWWQDLSFMSWNTRVKVNYE